MRRVKSAIHAGHGPNWSLLTTVSQRVIAWAHSLCPA